MRRAEPVTADLDATVAEIVFLHRQRNFAMGQRKRAVLAMGAFLRTVLGWRADLPEAERRQIAAMSAAWLKGNGEGADWAAFAPMIDASRAATAPWDAIEGESTRRMEKLARSLPVWPAWGEAQRGFGARSLAVIVGEAGNLSVYANKSKLWKRMGLAVIDGLRQGAPGAGASAEDWMVHGYNPMRRSAMFVIGDALVKQGAEYRAVYLARKAYERQRFEAAGFIVLPAARITRALKATSVSEGHIHARAQRYMEKRLLRDLWQAWNGRKADERVPPPDAVERLPSAQPAVAPDMAGELLPL